MPRRKTHLQAGAIVGVGAAVWHAAGNEDAPPLARTAGFVFGGLVGALAPDVLEPALNPRHRKFFHSFVLLVALIYAVLRAPGWLRQLRAIVEGDATAFREHRSSCESGSVEWLDGWLGEAVCEFVRGGLDGFLVGYASHLLLDGSTPAGLPFLAR